MPTHHEHDQTSEAHKRRAKGYSLQDRKPDTYQQLDQMLQRSTRKGFFRRATPIGIAMLIAIGVVILGLAGCVTQPEPGTYKVVKVVDGDTVYLRGTGDQIKVRLVCIDAPESSQAYGNASRKHLSRLIGGQAIQLEDRGQDRYGRTLGLIWANGYDMNWQMIKDGYAWDYDRYTCGRSYQQAEQQAREAKRGLWADPNPIPPWEYRRR